MSNNVASVDIRLTVDPSACLCIAIASTGAATNDFLVYQAPGTIMAINGAASGALVQNCTSAGSTAAACATSC